MKREKVDEIYHQMSKNIFTKEVLMKTEPVKDAISTIKYLSKIYDIYIITARTEKLISYVNIWLAKQNIDKDIRGIISSSYKEKQQICKEENITYLYDDDIRHVQKSRIKNSILFNPEKEKIDIKIQQVESWQQIRKGLLY